MFYKNEGGKSAGGMGRELRAEGKGGDAIQHPPLPAEDAFQDPQWLPETTNSTEPYKLGVPK